jgi:hypothetical protein
VKFWKSWKFPRGSGSEKQIFEKERKEGNYYYLFFNARDSRTLDDSSSTWLCLFSGKPQSDFPHGIKIKKQTLTV